jgi:hypothetical protein
MRGEVRDLGEMRRMQLVQLPERVTGKFKLT